jgi:hypothetical protein
MASYSYCQSNPIGNYDTTGLSSEDEVDAGAPAPAPDTYRVPADEAAGGNLLPGGAAPPEEAQAGKVDLEYRPDTSTTSPEKTENQEPTQESVSPNEPQQIKPRVSPRNGSLAQETPLSGTTGTIEHKRYETDAPILPFFIKDYSGGYWWRQSVRAYQDPGPGAPVGLAAIRQLNAGAPLAVAQFSREQYPGTSIENLTLLTLDAISGGVSALAPLARARPPSPAVNVVKDAPKTVEDFLPEARRRTAAWGARFGNNDAVNMAIPRQQALKRLEGLAPQVEEHLAKIATNPTSRDVPHWKTEIRAFLGEMERLAPHTGRKTGEEWAAKIAEWRRLLGQ